MLRKLHLPLVFAVAALASPLPGMCEVRLGTDQSSAAIESVADTAVRAYSHTYGITGGAVAVIRGDSVIYQRTFGHANVEFRVPVTVETRFQLSSTTKLFTGTLMALLAEDGLVDYGKPVRHYLPDLPGSWSDVLIIDILSHLSGLPEVLECGEDVNRDVALQCVYSLERPAGRREAFRYNQTNYFLALRVVETVTGQSFSAALAQYVFKPAGMTTAELNGNSRDVVPLRASNYYPDGSGGITLREYAFPEFLMSAAGLNASLGDMMAFATALSGDDLLNASAKRSMWQAPTMADGSPAGYALGWDLDDLRDGLQSVGHEGGSLTTYRVYPAYDLSVVVLTNGMHEYFGLDEFADVLASSFEADMLLPIDSLAYQAKLAYMTSGLGGAEQLLDRGRSNDAVTEAEFLELVTWLAEELTDLGDGEGAEGILSRYAGCGATSVCAGPG